MEKSIKHYQNSVIFFVAGFIFCLGGWGVAFLVAPTEHPFPGLALVIASAILIGVGSGHFTKAEAIVHSYPIGESDKDKHRYLTPEPAPADFIKWLDDDLCWSSNFESDWFKGFAAALTRAREKAYQYRVSEPFGQPPIKVGRYTVEVLPTPLDIQAKQWEWYQNQLLACQNELREVMNQRNTMRLKVDAYYTGLERLLKCIDDGRVYAGDQPELEEAKHLLKQ